MDTLLSQIQQALAPVFLPTAKKEAFLARVATFSEPKQRALLRLIRAVAKKQSTFFVDYLDKHPELVEQMTDFVRTESKHFRKEKEAESVQADEAVLSELEAELEGLFGENLGGD